MVYKVVYRDSLRRDLAQPLDSVVWEFAKSFAVTDPNSIISRLNRNDSTVILSEVFIRAVRNMRELDSITGGLLPLNTGNLKDRWGLHGRKLPVGWREPSAGECDSLLKIMKEEQVRLFVQKFTPKEVGEEQRGLDQKYWLDNIKIQRTSSLDLSPVVRGLLVDILSEYLELEGISDYFVQVDQVVRANGREIKDPWRVALERPELSEEIIFDRTLEINDQSISTSGFNRKAVSTPAGDFFRVIDPRSGRPVPMSFSSYSVICDDATTADLFSNALVIMGKDAALEFAKKMKLEVLITERSDTGEMKDYSTLRPSRRIQNKE